MSAYENNTIEALENDIWEYKKFPTMLVETCHYARKKKIGDLSLNELRTLLKQSVGVPYILPSIMQALEKDLFVDSRFYPGDLLLATLTAPEDIWQQNPKQCLKLKALVERGENDKAAFNKEMLTAIEKFKAMILP